MNLIKNKKPHAKITTLLFGTAPQAITDVSTDMLDEEIQNYKKDIMLYAQYFWLGGHSIQGRQFAQIDIIDTDTEEIWLSIPDINYSCVVTFKRARMLLAPTNIYRTRARMTQQEIECVNTLYDKINSLYMRTQKKKELTASQSPQSVGNKAVQRPSINKAEFEAKLSKKLSTTDKFLVKLIPNLKKSVEAAKLEAADRSVIKETVCSVADVPTPVETVTDILETTYPGDLDVLLAWLREYVKDISVTNDDDAENWIMTFIPEAKETVPEALMSWRLSLPEVNSGAKFKVYLKTANQISCDQIIKELVIKYGFNVSSNNT